MSWGKLCGTFAWHRKILEVGNEGAGAFARMISYASENLTGGRVSRVVAMQIALTPELLNRMVTAGLLDQEPDGDGYQLHDFGDYNPCGPELEARRAELRAKRAEAGRKGAMRRWQPDGKPAGDDTGHGKSDGKADGKHDGNLPSNGKTDGKRHGKPMAPSPSPSSVPVADPVTRGEADPLTLSSPKPKTKKATKTKPEIPGHQDVIACFVQEFEKARHVQPIIDGKQGQGAKDILEDTKSADAACAAVRRAFAVDKFVRETKPCLAYIASNINAYIGTAPTGTHRNGFQETPAEGRAWTSGLDTEVAHPAPRGPRGEILQSAKGWTPDDMTGGRQ